MHSQRHLPIFPTSLTGNIEEDLVRILAHTNDILEATNEDFCFLSKVLGDPVFYCLGVFGWAGYRGYVKEKSASLSRC